MAHTVQRVAPKGFISPYIAPPTPKSLDQAIEEARDYARMVSEKSGITSPESAVAWDIVEELLAAKSHQKTSTPSSFEEYCDEYPDAPEARIYDI